MSHKKYRTGTNCLNCGAEVQAKFCGNCGQENIEVRENFFHVAFHFVSDYFHFDSKFFRSMIPLFTNPGFLTKQYWDGKRINYIHGIGDGHRFHDLYGDNNDYQVERGRKC